MKKNTENLNLCFIFWNFLINNSVWNIESWNESNIIRKIFVKWKIVTIKLKALKWIFCCSDSTCHFTLVNILHVNCKQSKYLTLTTTLWLAIYIILSKCVQNLDSYATRERNRKLSLLKPVCFIFYPFVLELFFIPVSILKVPFIK